MKSFIFIIVWYLPLLISIQMVHSQSCSCQLDGSGMTMICDNVQSLIAYHQCVHEQLSLQSDLKLRRGGVITNLTIKNHQLRSLSNESPAIFTWKYISINSSDLRYFYLVHGTLKHIDNRALALIERALEYLDLSNNELQQIPKILNDNEEHSNLVYVY